MTLNIFHASRRSDFGFRRIVPGLILAGVAGMPTAGLAGSLGVIGDLTATTDYISRGVSQTMSGPALQGSIGVAAENGLSAYVWASNIDYVADGDPDDGAKSEIDLVVQFDHALTERWSATVGRIQYFNPGINPGLNYDYGEWWVELSLDERHSVSVYQSDSIFGTGEPSWYVGAATSFALPANLSVDVAAGHFDLTRAWGGAFNHVALALAGSIDALSWEAAFHATDGDADEMFYESVVEPRLVFSVTWTMW